ncbi:SAM-dependent methyltransferase [Paenibacillus marinisediminis]
MKEQYYDSLMHIKTVGDQKELNKRTYYHPYEPTPYAALDELFNYYALSSSDHIVDFGCGKGRLNFYIHYRFQANVTGIEMSETFYQEAIDNRNSYMAAAPTSTDSIQFHNCLAEEYDIDPRDNKFYFFNPFSVQIFIKVINNILYSAVEAEREIDVILYYPSEDYLYYLENRTPFEMVDEVRLPGWYEKDASERFVIYRYANGGIEGLSA